MNRTIFLGLFLCCTLVPISWGVGPAPKSDRANPEADSLSLLPISQEATEQSVLPDEPMLGDPGSSSDVSGVQPLPDLTPVRTGPSLDDLTKQQEAFRAAKTEAEENFTLADIKIRAFEATTEKEKRVLLREYYSSISTYIARKYPALKVKAESWNYDNQARLIRPRTEPDNVLPKKPEKYELLQKPKATTSSKETGILPALP